MSNDVRRIAEMLIAKDGVDAADSARHRAHMMQRANDLDGYRTWSRVAETIEELQRPANAEPTR